MYCTSSKSYICMEYPPPPSTEHRFIGIAPSSLRCRTIAASHYSFIPPRQGNVVPGEGVLNFKNLCLIHLQNDHAIKYVQIKSNQIKSMSYHRVIVNALSYHRVIVKAMSYHRVIVKAMSYHRVIAKAMSYHRVIVKVLSYHRVIVKALSFHRANAITP